MRVRTIEDVLSNNFARKCAKEHVEKYKTELKTLKVKAKTEAKEKGFAEGFSKGFAKGFKEGQKRENIATAQRILIMGLPVSLVQKATLLSIPEINKIAKSLAVDNTALSDAQFIPTDPDPIHCCKKQMDYFPHPKISHLA